MTKIRISCDEIRYFSEEKKKTCKRRNQYAYK